MFLNELSGAVLTELALPSNRSFTPGLFGRVMLTAKLHGAVTPPPAPANEERAGCLVNSRPALLCSHSPLLTELPPYVYRLLTRAPPAIASLSSELRLSGHAPSRPVR